MWNCVLQKIAEEMLMGSMGILIMDLKRLFRAPKFYLLLLFTLYFLWDFSEDLRLYAQAIGLGITPYVYPLFYGDSTSRLFAMLVIIVLMSDAPYIDSSQKYTYIRSGEKGWFLGKMLYIISISVIYQLLFVLLSVIVILPEMGLSSDWGDVLWTLANNPIEVTNMFGDASMASIVLEYSTFEAMLYTMILSILVSVVIGTFVWMINGITHSMLGTLLALVACTGEVFLSLVSATGFRIPFPVIISWMNLANVSVGEQITGKVPMRSLILTLIGISMILAVLIYGAIHKKVINIAED